MAATNEQVQQFVNDRVRAWCEKARALLLLADDHRAAMDDVYVNLSGSPDWIDAHDGHPPHLRLPPTCWRSNTAMERYRSSATARPWRRTWADFAAQWPIVLKLCVHAPLG